VGDTIYASRHITRFSRLIGVDRPLSSGAPTRKAASFSQLAPVPQIAENMKPDSCFKGPTASISSGRFGQPVMTRGDS